jgi:UDP-N-acetylmuramate dehydrogenase
VVAERHANYIINRGGATSADVRALVAHIRATVAAQSGITLEPEVQILGEEWPFSAT